jgi:hypothetical protein
MTFSADRHALATGYLSGYNAGIEISSVFLIPVNPTGRCRPTMMSKTGTFSVKDLTVWK